MKIDRTKIRIEPLELAEHAGVLVGLGISVGVGLALASTVRAAFRRLRVSRLSRLATTAPAFEKGEHR